ncbi:2-isopropylmalate synthase [Balneatrix alpica]|uniref:2-isopropylmalate synthase n=1 Tax=Balneatrix alpica TaxID=75684 RepID=A0ABV5ZDW6_9GAMM|nr:2-isopropylmalate synthase [Balneatrix alpica]
MSRFDHRKYRPAPVIALPDRQWPNRTLSQAPQWCAVDLRDGNQALVEPMNVEQKTRMWELLVKLGFKHIEVGFPAASQPDFDFVRLLIEENRIPEDVTIQVLVQAREELIARTYESLRGVKQAIVHVYNSTNPTQRQYVFNTDRAGVKGIAVQGARWVAEYARQYPQTQWSFQYSPESFSCTEVDFAVEVCDAVIAQWLPSQCPLIINLPATVEVNTPNVFADQVEWFCRHSQYRQHYSLSIHTHNDRGCAVAAAELAVLAGADRIEGTLLGNGERTGNMDLVTMAMNLYSQGVDPGLDLSAMDEIIATVSACTQISLHPRHPYAGELVYTAFSGSHQDAIRKCLAATRDLPYWDVAYLPIDPADLGRSYEAVIRINSQSGKGGVSYVLERDRGLQLPRWLQIDFSRRVQAEAEVRSAEISAEQISALFEQEYLQVSTAIKRFHLDQDAQHERLQVELAASTGSLLLQGEGQGALSALVDAWQRHYGDKVDVLDYAEHALTQGTQSQAVAYILAAVNGERVIGVAQGRDVVSASLQAVVNAAERARQQAAMQQSA